jgi:hypothetical protein
MKVCTTLGLDTANSERATQLDSVVRRMQVFSATSPSVLTAVDALLDALEPLVDQAQASALQP